VVRHVHSIGLAVTDFKKSAEWYRHLGFEGSDELGTSGLFKAGDAVLYLFETDSPKSNAHRDLNPVHNTPGLDHLSFRVDDVDAYHARLLQKGVKIATPPTNQEWGSRTIAVSDPEGNVIWFLGPLKA
jgi:catechol 2,3-dioxygenase-like lactoylglutathione lyase family enzyme